MLAKQKVCQVLKELVAEFGTQILEEPEKCRTMLRALVGDHKKEISVLIAAMEEGIPTELLKPGILVDVVRGRLTQKLQDERGLTEEMSRWAVDTLGEVLVTDEPFEFMVVKVNEVGEIIKRIPKRANWILETLPGGVRLEMVWIPDGSFEMGSPPSEKDRLEREGPVHQVKVKGFYMGKYPVTQAQYEAIMGSNPSRFKGSNRPVEQVSWDDAVAFCEKLSQLMGKTYRLPSEAEWEYACRAGTQTPFHFGPTITTDLANYDGKTFLGLVSPTYGSGPKGIDRGQTTEVGFFEQGSLKVANNFGLSDMHGNVWEWCQDSWHEDYTNAPDSAVVWIGGKVMRGGSWFHVPRYCRSAYRYHFSPVSRHYDFGFRVSF